MKVNKDIMWIHSDTMLIIITIIKNCYINTATSRHLKYTIL